jgi:hypothetical protein
MVALHEVVDRARAVDPDPIVAVAGITLRSAATVPPIRLLALVPLT